MDKNTKNILINEGYSIREYNIIKNILRGEKVTDNQINEVRYILKQL